MPPHMAEGMPSHFLLYLLNEQPLFARFGKLATASLRLQSQMAAAIAIDESPQLKSLITEEHGKHFPGALAAAATKKLETLSSESLRTTFINQFGHFMTAENQSNLRASHSCSRCPCPWVSFIIQTNNRT